MGFSVSDMTTSSKMATPSSDMGYSVSDLRYSSSGMVYSLSQMGFSVSEMTTLASKMVTPASDMTYSASDLGYLSSGMTTSSDMGSSASDLGYTSSGMEFSVSGMTSAASDIIYASSNSVHISSMGYLQSNPDYSNLQTSNVFNPSIGIESSSNDMGFIPYTTLAETSMDGLSTQIDMSLPSRFLPTIVRSSNATTSDFTVSTATYMDITTTVRTMASVAISSNGNVVSSLDILTTAITSTDTTTPISSSVTVPDTNLEKYLLKMRFNPLDTDYTEPANKQKLINSLIRLFEEAMRRQESLPAGALRRKKRDTETGSSNIKVQLDNLEQSTSTSATAQFTVDLGNGPISADEAMGLLNLLSKEEMEEILGVELLEPISAVNVQSGTIYTSGSTTLPQATPLHIS
ncbi:uncharacterized protein LOC130013153 [Patella vulgata]|uniref:uncharacterized protein LOC130013153 n=1 Tax=Patella vulgata TaxID=6465 RepID=UPI0024A874FE|nr:uncharacterized protein LOC130013153 [Patella vulgata]